MMGKPVRTPSHAAFLKLSAFHSKRRNEITFLFNCKTYSALLVPEMGLVLCQSSNLMQAHTQKFRQKMSYQQCSIPSSCSVTALQFIET